jgi:hypothetical protein
MATPLVPVVQAAMNALAAWLTAGLPPYVDATQPGVLVSQEWPAPAAPLPLQALTILRAGDPREQTTQPEVDSYEEIHDAITEKIVATLPINTDQKAIGAVNAAVDSYEAHRIDASAHQSADAANAVTAPVATDQASAITRANNLRAVAVAHYAASAHATADSSTALAAIPPATNQATLFALVTALINDLHRHYVARLYVWRLGEIEQEVQLDCWSTSPAWRDDLMARLEPLLNAAPSESAGFGYDDPVRPGVTVPLADGWSGYATFYFEQTAPIENPGAIQQNEYRATVSGTAYVFRLVKAQSPRLAMAQLQLTANQRATSSTATVSWSASGTPTESYS